MTDHNQELVERVAKAICIATQPGSNPDVLVGPDAMRLAPKWTQFAVGAEAAIAAIAAAQSDGVWQPIETAPKDGDDILVHWDGQFSGAGCLVVSWDDSPPQAGWPWATLDGPYYHEAAFSHWRPLPDPPALSAPEPVEEQKQ